MTDLRDQAERAVALLDLTNLDDACDEHAIEQLCQRASTPVGPVAAVCLWPQFVEQAVAALKNTPIKVCTVANFPSGEASLEAVLAQTEAAVNAGVDEVDLVMPYRALMSGDRSSPAAQIAAVRAALPTEKILKVIIESGALASPELIGEASRLAIQAGADFIKTSTGKIATGATLAAAEVMLTEIARATGPVGFKAAGGLRTASDAAAYIALAEGILGADWVCGQNFRLGASSLLDELLVSAGAESRG